MSSQTKTHAALWLVVVVLVCSSYVLGVEIQHTNHRTAFVRMEPGAQLEFEVLNNSPEDLVGMMIVGMVNHIPVSKKGPVTIRPSTSYSFVIPIDTRLKPGDYAVAVAVSNNGAEIAAKELSVRIVPRELPNQMPVVMWSFYGDMKVLKKIGFTHKLWWNPVDHQLVWDAKSVIVEKSPRVDTIKRYLDEALREQFGVIAQIRPGGWMMENVRSEYGLMNRDGKLSEGYGVCPNFPIAREFAYNVGASTAKTFQNFPSLQAASTDSEYRDHNQLCFHEHDKLLYKKPIPPGIPTKEGVMYANVPNFPANRVIRDDDRILSYMKWFWQEGDGWNALYAATLEGIKAYRNDMWTFYDPATRVPSVSGSGGPVDYISNWTYTYTDPIKIERATDELFAMAKLAAKPQEVMKMTQIIWYRNQVAPITTDPSVKLAKWEKDHPEGDYITIAPDHLRESFWSKISHPVKGIMYHGWASLVITDEIEGGGSRICTNTESKDALQTLLNTVIKPLGPTLKQVPDRKADVAVLESFASQMFAGVGDRGWGFSWGNDAYLILRYAQLQPEVVYDETILKYGLGDYKILVLVECPVLTRSIAGAIKRFQAGGGIVIADETVSPGIVPDMILRSYNRTNTPDVDKAHLLKQAVSLRAELDSFYSRYTDSSNMELITRARQYEDTDYLFIINDHRGYGDYVGHRRLVMENGLPAEGTVIVSRESGYAYDLIANRPVDCEAVDGRMTIPVALEPAGGRLYMITSKAIRKTIIEAPETAKTGSDAEINIRVTDESGEPITAIVPLEVKIVDSENEIAEYSGFYGAKDGHLKITLQFAANDHKGLWTIRVKNLASGELVSVAFNVN